MRQAKRAKQNNRRMSSALMCAALLHSALFIAIDKLAPFPDNSNNPDRGRVTRIQLNLPQSKEKQQPLFKDELEPSSTQPKDQVKQDTVRVAADENEPEQSSTLTVEKAVQTPPAPPLIKPHSEQVEPKTDNNAGSNQKVLPAAEALTTVAHRISNRTANEDAPQSSNRKSLAQQGSANRSRIEQQEFTVYLQQLIEKKRRYPLAARRRNIEGTVEFAVHVSREGVLSELTLNSSSGSRILDKAAEDLLERVFPVDYPLQENVRTTIRIIYKLTEV